MIYKSPFNYIGNKHRMIACLQDIFPQNINTFVDMFCGGGDVLINTEAEVKIANDVNYHVIDVLQTFQNLSIETILDHIDRRIAEWNLSKTNSEAFRQFRQHYNENPNPLDLYVLVCYSFNYQFRFNSRHQYNNPFGKNRSCFSNRMRENLISFVRLIRNVRFTKNDFRAIDLTGLQPGDFIYADPPYTLTCGSYNDGKRGFSGWSAAEDMALLSILDRLDDSGISFGLSNVIEHKGKRHPFLSDWAQEKGYTIHYPNINYNNCNYQSNNKQYRTVEVVITNY